MWNQGEAYALNLHFYGEQLVKMDLALDVGLIWCRKRFAKRRGIFFARCAGSALVFMAPAAFAEHLPHC